MPRGNSERQDYTRGHIWRRFGGRRRKEWKDAYRRLAHGRSGEVKVGRRADPEERVFTGTCPVRQHTGDGAYVGRCYHSTYDGICHLHGDVSHWLVEGADLKDADDRLTGR